jgi:hypothetical protein
VQELVQAGLVAPLNQTSAETYILTRYLKG